MMRMAERRQSISLDSDIVISEAGQKYMGVLPVRTLMESLSTAHQFGSRYSDSLSGLPNRVVLEHTLKERLEQHQPTGLLRVDVMYLEAYNRKFGTAHGDELIKGLVEILQEVAPVREGNVLTHLGGDDFVVVTHPDNVERLSSEVRTRFSALAPRLFPFETSMDGYMEIEEHGRINRVPLCSLAIAGITGRSSRLTGVMQALQFLDTILHSVQASGTGGCAIDVVQPRKAA
jgi:diguanylate cyclase (GGDEF)-like protein